MRIEYLEDFDRLPSKSGILRRENLTNLIVISFNSTRTDLNIIVPTEHDESDRCSQPSVEKRR